jgi:hypothetical protein
MAETDTAPVPPAAAIKHHLETMQATLTTMQQQGAKYNETMVVLADVRDIIKEALDVTHNMTEDLLNRMIDIEHQLKQGQQAAQRPSLWTEWRGWLVHGALVASVIGGLWALMAWTALPLKPLAVGLDRVLVQTYATLPKPVQEQVSSVYAQVRLEGPAKRQGAPRR